ncbi:hypothetical protein EBM89_08205 [Cellulomonas triticagri]|uniref:Uncharacterized protein n=1 Tax=Cellulomonas triticagri TaxID=2483352 RepID=A0A3M2JK13_9CELL|nr:hypothetical protein EBM89_08205 [Cellulomonas triticagri]
MTSPSDRVHTCGPATRVATGGAYLAVALLGTWWIATGMDRALYSAPLSSAGGPGPRGWWSATAVLGGGLLVVVPLVTSLVRLHGGAALPTWVVRWTTVAYAVLGIGIGLLVVLDLLAGWATRAPTLAGTARADLVLQFGVPLVVVTTGTWALRSRSRAQGPGARQASWRGQFLAGALPAALLCLAGAAFALSTPA